MLPTRVTQPLLQQRFELAHVLKAEVESLEAGNGGLAEVIAIELPHGKANIALPGNNTFGRGYSNSKEGKPISTIVSAIVSSLYTLPPPQIPPDQRVPI